MPVPLNQRIAGNILKDPQNTVSRADKLMHLCIRPPKRIPLVLMSCHSDHSSRLSTFVTTVKILPYINFIIH